MARIGKDLAKVRKQQGMSLEEIHTSSRIPITILKTIEDGSIFSDLATNNTMIRSNVRSFARVLKLDDHKIIEALDMLQKGKDIGFLPEEEQPQNTDQEQKETTATPTPAQKSSSRSNRKKNRVHQNAKASVTTPEKEPQKTEELEQNDTDTSYEGKGTAQATQEKDSDKDKSPETPQEDVNTEAASKPTTTKEISNSMFNKDLKEVDWDRLNKRKNLKRPKQSISFVAVLAAVIILSLSVLYFMGYFNFLFDNSEQVEVVDSPKSGSSWLESDPSFETPTDNESSTANQEAIDSNDDSSNDAAITAEDEQLSVSAEEESSTSNETTNESANDLDSENANLAASEQEQPITQENTPVVSSDAMQAFGTELEVLIYAATDNLSPIRIQWDNLNTLRPYWIEYTEAMRVSFEQELLLRTLDYDRIILIFNGHPIGDIEEQFFDQEKGLVVISRSFFENQSERFLEPYDDSEGYLGRPAPTRVYDRPIFN